MLEHISDDANERVFMWISTKRYNLGNLNIESMSGRSPKKGNRFRLWPKKTKSNDEILDEFLEWF
nr:hypothetical protein [Mycoplasmopsis bovis]